MASSQKRTARWLYVSHTTRSRACTSSKHSASLGAKLHNARAVRSQASDSSRHKCRCTQTHVMAGDTPRTACAGSRLFPSHALIQTHKNACGEAARTRQASRPFQDKSRGFVDLHACRPTHIRARTHMHANPHCRTTQGLIYIGRRDMSRAIKKPRLACTVTKCARQPRFCSAHNHIRHHCMEVVTVLQLPMNTCKARSPASSLKKHYIP